MIATRLEKKSGILKKGKRPSLEFGIEWLLFLVIF
jgi:hypothetical protein